MDIQQTKNYITKNIKNKQVIINMESYGFKNVLVMTTMKEINLILNDENLINYNINNLIINLSICYKNIDIYFNNKHITKDFQNFMDDCVIYVCYQKKVKGKKIDLNILF